MLKKSYDVNGTGFRIKEDLSLDESEKIEELFKGFYEEGNNYSAGIRKFLSLVLRPESGTVNAAGFDFGGIKESVALQIVKDFFLHRLKSTAAMTDYFNSLMKEFSPPAQS